MRQRIERTWNTLLVSALSLTGFLMFWQMAVIVGDVDPYTLPSPAQVFRLAWQKGFLLQDVLLSSSRVLAGFFMAVLIATPLGLIMGISPRLRTLVNPVLSLIRPLPAMSWIPVSIIWFGLGEEQKYYIVFMGSLAPILVYTTEATRDVDPILLRAARNLGASRWQEVVYVLLPAALPNLLAGLKVVLAIAWTCVISAEMIGTNSGLGFAILHGKDIGGTDLVFLGMLCISMTVLVLDVLFRGLRWLLLPHRRKAH